MFAYIILQYQTVPVNHAQMLLIRACETESQLSSSRISADKSQADKSDNLDQVGFAALVNGYFDWTISGRRVLLSLRCQLLTCRGWQDIFGLWTRNRVPFLR